MKNTVAIPDTDEYSGAAEPPVRSKLSHLSGRREPPFRNRLSQLTKLNKMVS